MEDVLIGRGVEGDAIFCFLYCALACCTFILAFLFY